LCDHELLSGFHFEENTLMKHFTTIVLVLFLSVFLKPAAAQLVVTSSTDANQLA
jgi:hypothetical protein